MTPTDPTPTPSPTATATAVTAVRGDRVSRAVLDHLRTLVTSGGLAPGDRLPAERDLAERLGVGRNSVREALRELEMLGLVEARRGAGTFVRAVDTTTLMAPFHTVIPLSEAAADDVMEFRKAFEPEVAALAARNADDRALGDLQTALRRFDRAVRGAADGDGGAGGAGGDGEPGTNGEGAPPTDDAFDADVRFHEAVACCTHNPLVVAVQQALAELYVRLRVRLPRSDYEPDDRAARGHQALFGAIAAGDGESARQVMREHLVLVEGSLRQEDV